MRRLALVYALLCPLPLRAESSASATVYVTATIASFATIEVDDNFARVVSNSTEAVAWANDVPLTDEWVCVLDCDPDVRWASR